MESNTNNLVEVIWQDNEKKMMLAWNGATKDLIFIDDDKECQLVCVAVCYISKLWCDWISCEEVFKFSKNQFYYIIIINLNLIKITNYEED